MTKKKQNYSAKNKLWSSIRLLVSGLLFYSGVALIFFGSGLGNSYLVQLNAEQASSELTAKKADQNKQHKTTYDASKTESITTKRLLTSRHKKAYAIGQIAIPTVNIHTPLFAGYGSHNQNLAYGVVTCLPERIMGGQNNYVLAGHYMGTYGGAVLDNLHLAKAGDIVYVTDLHHIYAYRIQNISFTIKPTQVEVENNVQKKRLLTLITCSDFNTSKYGYGAHRTVAQGELIGKTKATSKNLLAAELTGKQESKQTRKITLVTDKGHKTIAPQKQTSLIAQPSFFQNTRTLSTIIICLTILFLLIIIAALSKIWF